jgi:hypothetical protein
MKDFKKFPSIENFVGLHHDIKKNIFVNDRPKMTYYGKVKLHGTNAGVTIRRREEGDKAAFYVGDISVTPLKRTSFISPQDDNAGFATWVGTKLDFFVNIFSCLNPMFKDVTVFGEWAGKGIQKTDAVSKIEGKHFFIFAIRVDDKWITNPSDLLTYTDTLNSPVEGSDIHIIPRYTEKLQVDFSSAVDVHRFVEDVNVVIEPLNIVDPYIKYTFGIEGNGEGFVFYPVTSEVFMSDDMFKYVFKAKVEAHSISGNKNKAAEVDPILHDNAANFAAEFVTEARLKQAISEVYPGRDLSDASRKNTGPILAWVCRDVMKESVASLETAGMEWKQVAKAVSSRAAQMYFKLLENL